MSERETLFQRLTLSLWQCHGRDVDGWTIDELAERAAEALASEGVRAPNGRVAELPARRVIRWYATIGLLDRPLRTGGRVARYGERHLLQLVAVKRRQAEGYPLAAIQAELAGATDATLRRVADLPTGTTPAPPPSSPSPSPPSPPSAPAQPDADGGRQFWRTTTAVPAAAATDTTPTASGSVAPVYPVPLHPAATLTLPRPPDADDLTAIHTAARPLLDLLVARGLLPDRPTHPSSRRLA